MSFVDTVLAVLPVDGMTYPELRKALGGRAESQIGAALRKLKEAGKAERKAIERPRDKRKSGQNDWHRSPKVIWRRIE